MKLETRRVIVNIGYSICEDFERPPKELLKAFADVPAANIGDAMNRLAAISGELISVNGARLVGPAYTVRVPAGDNLLFYYAIDNARPGDVIVVDGGGFVDRALCGEIMATFAQERGLGGFVINGAIRDRVAISQMSFPVFAKGAVPAGPYKNGPGEIGVPVCIGGRVIHPGDILVGDGSGLVSFGQKEAPEILENARRIVKKEADMMEKAKKGIMDLTWMYEKIAGDGCEIVKTGGGQ